MKKVVLSIILATLLTGCGNDNDLSYTRVSTVVDIQDGNVIGEIDERMTTEVPLQEFKGKSVKIGDTIKVTYDYVTEKIKKIEIEEGE